MPPKVTGQGERPNPEAAASALLNAVAHIPGLQGDPEAAGRYLAAWLCLAYEALEDYVPVAPAMAYAAGGFGLPGGKALPAHAIFAEAQLRWCLAALKDPRAVTPPLPQPSPSLEAIKANRAVCSAPPLSEFEERQRQWQLQQRSTLCLAVPPLLLAYLLASCWSSKRAEDAAVAVCTWAASQWHSDRMVDGWVQPHSLAAVGLAKNLPPLLKSMQDEQLTGVLRSLNHLLLTGSYNFVDALQDTGGALLDACAQVLGPSSKRSEAVRTAAAHFLAGASRPPCQQRLKYMQQWLLRWPAVTVECCKLLGNDLGPYNQHGGPEHQYSTWRCLLAVAYEAGRPWVPASTLLAADPGRAVVRLLRTCLDPVPCLKGGTNIGDYHVKLRGPHDSPGKHLSGPLHMACLRDCLRCMGFFCAHATLFDDMLTAGLVEEVHSLFSRHLPAAVLEEACVLVGMMLQATDAEEPRDYEYLDLKDYPVMLIRGHYLRVCCEESELYGVPYALCQWAKSGPMSVSSLTWAAELGQEMRPALSQKGASAPVVSAPSKRYGLAAMLWITGGSGALFDRLASPGIVMGIVAEVDEIARRLADDPDITTPAEERQWSVGALELLRALDSAVSTPEVAGRLFRAGALDGVLKLLERGYFDENCTFMSRFLTLIVTAVQEPTLRAACQKRPQLTLALMDALDRVADAVYVTIKMHSVARPPKVTCVLLQLAAALWGKKVAIDVPHAPKRTFLVKTALVLVSGVWETCLDRPTSSDTRALVHLLCNVLVSLDVLEIVPQTPSIAQLLRGALGAEAEYGADHFKDHSDQCGQCMYYFGQQLGRLMTAMDYFTGYECYLPVLASAKIPLELDRLCYVINKHLSQEAWAPGMLTRLQKSIDMIREGELRARKARKHASAHETPSTSVQDLNAAEAAARKAEAELLAELEAEERQQKKKEGQGQKGGKGGKAAKKGKGKKKQKGATAAQQPARARTTSPASEGQSESEDEGAAASLAVPQVNVSGLDARSIAASLTAGSLAGASSRGSLNGMHGAAEETAEAEAEEGPADSNIAPRDEAVEGYLRMMKQLEAEAEEVAGEENSWMGQGPGMRHAGRGHGSGCSSSWEAAAGAEGAQDGRKGRVMAVQRPASARNPVVQLPPPPPPRRQQPPQPPAQQPMPAGAASPPVPQPISRPRSAPASQVHAPAAAGSSAMDGSHLLRLLQRAPPAQQAPRQAAQQAQQQQAQQRVQQPGFPVSGPAAMQAAAYLPPVQPPAPPPAGPAEHDMAAADDLDAIMPWLAHSVPQPAVQAPQKQAPAPGQAVQGSSGVASPLVDLLHQLLPPEGAGHAVQGVEEMGAGREAAAASEPDPALRHVLSCPLTKAPFVDPVIAEDGVTYERAAIWAHLQQGGTSPLTGQPLQLGRLRPNHAVRAAVQAFLPN